MIKKNNKKILLWWTVVGGWSLRLRLPSIAKLLLCLVRVGVLQVSWAVGWTNTPKLAAGS